MRAASLEFLRSLEGRELGPSQPVVVSQERIDAFAECTLDRQWIHVDRERAMRESPFGAPIAHGYYTLSRIAALFFECLEVTGFPAVINYGLNKVRFPAPLKEGASYRLAPEILSVTEVKGGVEVVFKNTVEIQGSDRPACVAECVFRFLNG